MVRRTFPRFVAAGLVALAAAAVAPAQSPNPWRVDASAPAANPWRVESSPVTVAPMPRPAGACCEAACCDKPVAVAPMPRQKVVSGSIRVEIALSSKPAAAPTPPVAVPAYVLSQPVPVPPVARPAAVPPTPVAPPPAASAYVFTQPAPATPVPPAPVAVRATAAAPAYADVPARARLSGTWYRELPGMVVAVTFAGDELRLTAKQAVNADACVCLTITADYAVTKDGTVHGVFTGVDVDVCGDKKGEAALELAGIAADVQSLVDQPFAFRTRSTTGGLMLNSLRVAGGPADGRFDAAVYAGLYKHAKDVAAVPCPKPLAVPVGRVLVPSKYLGYHYPEYFSPDVPLPSVRALHAMEFPPAGVMLPPPCPVPGQVPMPPGFTFNTQIGMPMPNACPVPVNGPCPTPPMPVVSGIQMIEPGPFCENLPPHFFRVYYDLGPCVTPFTRMTTGCQLPTVACPAPAIPVAYPCPAPPGFTFNTPFGTQMPSPCPVPVAYPCPVPPAVIACPPMPALSPPKVLITDVIQMVQQGCPPDVIVKQIQGSGSHFTLTPENAGFLRLTGVPDAVVSVMQVPPAPPACVVPCPPERVRVVAACEATAAIKTGPRKMTLAEVVELIRAKAGDDVILTHAAMTGSSFTLTVADIKALKQAGASDTLILGLMQSGNPVNGYSADPNVRMERLLNQSEDLREIQETWRRFWFNDQPVHLTPERIHGGIMN